MTATTSKTSNRLSTRLGVVKAARRRIHCDYCSASFSSDRPQDPEREKDHGTCIECRDLAAVEWSNKHGKPISDGITYFARHA